MMESIARWFKWLSNTYGLNYSVFFDTYDQTLFLKGLQTTILLSISCIFLSIMVGLIGAWLQGSRLRAARIGTAMFVQFFRNTPPLVQLAFFYYAVSSLLPTLTDQFGAQAPIINNLGWAIISFSLFAGAFNIEIFRSGIEAVPTAMTEAAESLGYTRFQIYRIVVVPIAFRICLPSLGNNLVNLVKTTTLAYAIGVPELLYASAQIWSEAMNVREMMVLLLITYVALVAVLVGLMQRWERSLRIPGYIA